MRVAVIQMVSGEQTADNLQQAQALVKSAIEQGAQLAVLPENFLTYGQSAPDLDSIRNTYLPALADLAASNSIALVAGTLPFREALGSKPYASSFVFNSLGEQLFRYDKIHLFDANVADATGSYRESDHFAKGSQLGLVDACDTRLGLSVCYDLRFPEYYRLLAQQGAKVVCVPSAFTEVTGAAHWEVLLRARAIENQCFILAANQGGVHPCGRSTWGHSMIVNPWGEVMSKLTSGPGCLVQDLDLASIDSLQVNMPVLSHRVF